MPTDFFLNQAEYAVTVQGAAEIKDQFSTTDLEIYNSFGNDSISAFDYTSLDDGPDPPDWETQLVDRYLEVWWSTDGIPDTGFSDEFFEIRDTEMRNFPIIGDYPVMLEYCPLYVNGESVEFPMGIARSWLIQKGYWNGGDLEIEVRGSYLRASVLLIANDSLTLGESWDARLLEYSLTYEIDFEAMKPSAWSLISQLITFQKPDFGIPGLFGEIVSYAFGLGIWITIAIIAYTVLTRIIPTISGGVEG